MALVTVALAGRLARAVEPGAAAPPGGPPASVAAARPLDAEVERHAVLGQRLLERGQTQEAIGEFRHAYELRADARFLYDIGEGYRRLGLREQALFFFDHYLSAAPDAPDREDVEEQIATLRRATVAAAPPAASPTAPTSAPLGRAPEVALVAADAAGTARPLWRHWWTWTALGAVIAGGVVAALVLGRAQTPVPTTALGDRKFY